MGRSVGVSASLTAVRASGIHGAAVRAFRAGLSLLPLVVSGCAQLQQLTTSPAERLADDVVIERDAWGVPHVRGGGDEAVLFGLAFAMAEDHYARIEADLLVALGRAAPDDGGARVADDLAGGAADVETRARAEYEREPPDRRALWDAFAHGLNHYLHSQPATSDRLLLRYEPWMLFARAAVLDAPVVASWGWVVGPEQSATGEPLLLAALAAPWYGSGRVYEATLHSDDGFDVAGAFVLGLPLPRAGHNQHVAWLDAAAAAPDPRQHGSLPRALALSRATSLEAFRAALADAATRRWNTLYADVDGRTAAWVEGIETPGGTGPLQLGPAPSPGPVPAGGWTVAALEQAASDAFGPSARDDVRALVDEWERVGGPNPRRAAALDSVITVLREWDQRFSASSAAAPLYADWLEEYARGDTASAYGRFLALENVAARLAREPASRTWGDILRLQRSPDGSTFADSLPSLPLGAAPAGTGAGFSVETRAVAGGRRYAAGGRAWTAVMRLGRPPESRTVVPFGPTAPAGGPPFQDQAERFAAGALKELRAGTATAEVRERYRPGRRARVLQQ